MKVGLEALHAYAYAYQNQPFLHCKNQRTCLLCSLIGSLLNEICLGKKKKKNREKKEILLQQPFSHSCFGNFDLAEILCPKS